MNSFRLMVKNRVCRTSYDNWPLISRELHFLLKSYLISLPQQFPQTGILPRAAIHQF